MPHQRLAIPRGQHHAGRALVGGHALGDHAIVVDPLSGNGGVGRADRADATVAKAKERARNIFDGVVWGLRVKEIALLETSQLTESMQLEAEAQAKALQIKVDTETKVELVKAEAEATATEKRAEAAKIRAEATKAEKAALGLAETAVEAARVDVAEKQVAVTRAEGLAQAEVAQAQAEAEGGADEDGDPRPIDDDIVDADFEDLGDNDR